MRETLRAQAITQVCSAAAAVRDRRGRGNFWHFWAGAVAGVALMPTL